MRENYSKLARLSSNHFHSANNKLWGKIYDWELKWKLSEILVTKNLAVKWGLYMKTTPKRDFKTSESHALLEKLM